MHASFPPLARVLAAIGLAGAGCRHDRVPPNPAGAPDTTAQADASETAEAADAGETVVRAEDDGRTFDLPAGGILTFRLASHSGTGFVWKPAPLDGGALSQVGERTTEVSSVLPGAPKVDVYRFVARSAGTLGIEMDYQRPWGNQPPVKTVRVTVNVH
jgi:predicted secreted protein